MGLISDSIENDSLLRRDSVLAYLEFKVGTLSMTLYSNTASTSDSNTNSSTKNAEIAKFKFEQSNFKLEALPRYDSFLFQMHLGSFYLIDTVVDANSFHSVLIYPKKSSQQSHTEVFSLVYEHNPLVNFQKAGSKYKANLSVKSCGLDIILNMHVVEHLKNFATYLNVYFDEANAVLFTKSKTKHREPSVYTAKKINPILSTNFNFDITSPKLIIPQNFKNSNPYVIILDFGRLTLENMRYQRGKEFNETVQPVFTLSTSNHFKNNESTENLSRK